MQKLKIDNLCVEVDGKIILDNFSLEIKEGEIHAIMGPNGTGKSTLSKVIMGDTSYKIISGDIFYNDKRINDLSVDERARMGIFLGMQLPMEIMEQMTTQVHLEIRDPLEIQVLHQPLILMEVHLF